MRKLAAALILVAILLAGVVFGLAHRFRSFLRNPAPRAGVSASNERTRTGHQDSDQPLFREAVQAGRSDGEAPKWYIFTEIAKAQAVHGYYDDAIETAKLVHEYPDQLLITLVGTRAKNGDVAGAKQMAAAISTAKLKSEADEAIAIAQAYAGDVDGARDSMRDLVDKSRVLEAVGTHQVDQGDVEGALRTASEMKRGWDAPVLFDVVRKLRERGDLKRAHEIAQRITDPDMAQSAEAERSETSAPLKDACAVASNDATSGKYADAYSALETAKCDCRTVAYIHQAAGDPTGAAQAMRGCPNLADVSAGMAGLAKKAAERGNMSDALIFAESVQVSGASYEEGYLAPTLRDIGQAWAKTAD